MDGSERFPDPLPAICQQDDIQILVRVMTNDRAHSGVDPLFLREQHVASAIHRELKAVTVHPLPALLRLTVANLGSEEGCSGLGRE